MSASCVICTQRPPRQALDRGRACRECGSELWRQLDELATLVPLLRGLLEPGRAPKTPEGRVGKGAGSPAPLDVAVLDLLDPRSDTSVHGVLAAHWRKVVHGRGLSTDTVAVADPVRGLRTHIDWCTQQPWLEDLARDVRRLHRAVLTACGETTSRVARCPKAVDADTGRECGGPIVASPSSRVAVCTRCGDEWQRAQWGLLGRLQDAS